MNGTNIPLPTPQLLGGHCTFPEAWPGYLTFNLPGILYFVIAFAVLKLLKKKITVNSVLMIIAFYLFILLTFKFIAGLPILARPGDFFWLYPECI